MFLSMHSPADGQLGCFHHLAIVNRAATTSIYMYLFACLFPILRDVYLGVELQGHMEILFNLLRNHQTVFHSS